MDGLIFQVECLFSSKASACHTLSNCLTANFLLLIEAVVWLVGRREGGFNLYMLFHDKTMMYGVCPCQTGH